jgi:hypothetical protein
MATPRWNQNELHRWVDDKLKVLQAEINKYIEAETERTVKREVSEKIGIFAEHSREAITDEICREDGMPQRVLRKMVELEARKLGNDGKSNNSGSSGNNNNISSSVLANLRGEMTRNTHMQKKLRQRMNTAERAVAKLRKQGAQHNSGQEKVASAMPDGPIETEVYEVCTSLPFCLCATSPQFSFFERQSVGLPTDLYRKQLRREIDKLQEEVGQLRQLNGQLQHDIRHLEKRDTQRAAQIEEMMQLLSQAGLALGDRMT